MAEANGKLTERSPGEKRSFLEGFMTGYATSVQNGAAQYAALFQQLAEVMGEGGLPPEPDATVQPEETEGLSEEEMSQLEQMAAQVHDPDPTAEDGVLDADDPNVRMILGN